MPDWPGRIPSLLSNEPFQNQIFSAILVKRVKVEQGKNHPPFSKGGQGVII